MLNKDITQALIMENKDKAKDLKSTQAKPKKKGRPAKEGLSDKQKEALALVEGQGLSHSQAAKALGVSRGAISQRLKDIADPAVMKDWKERKAEIMEAIQASFILSLTPDAIKGMVKRRGLVDFGILFDKTRIQKGEATEIVDFRGFLEHSLADLQAKRRALEAQLADSEPITIDVSPVLSEDKTEQASDMVSLDHVEAEAEPKNIEDDTEVNTPS